MGALLPGRQTFYFLLSHPSMDAKHPLGGVGATSPHSSSVLDNAVDGRDDIVFVGQIELFECRAVWNRRVGRGHAQYRGIEVFEQLLGQKRRNLGPSLITASLFFCSFCAAVSLMDIYC